MSLPARAVLLALLVTAAIAGWWRLTAFYEARGYARAQAEAKAAADSMRERNLELQRAAEKRYTVQAEVRQEFITITEKEVRYVAQPMAICPVPADARRLLNDAAACAREDRPAACGAGEPVRAPG